MKHWEFVSTIENLAIDAAEVNATIFQGIESCLDALHVRTYDRGPVAYKFSERCYADFLRATNGGAVFTHSFGNLFAHDVTWQHWTLHVLFEGTSIEKSSCFDVNSFSRTIRKVTNLFIDITKSMKLGKKPWKSFCASAQNYSRFFCYKLNEFLPTSWRKKIIIFNDLLIEFLECWTGSERRCLETNLRFLYLSFIIHWPFGSLLESKQIFERWRHKDAQLGSYNAEVRSKRLELLVEMSSYIFEKRAESCWERNTKICYVDVSEHAEISSYVSSYPAISAMRIKRRRYFQRFQNYVIIREIFYEENNLTVIPR